MENERTGLHKFGIILSILGILYLITIIEKSREGTVFSILMILIGLIIEIYYYFKNKN